MKKFLFKIFYFIPFFLIVGGVNYSLDEQMVFHQDKLDQAVKWLLNEDTVYGISHVHKPYIHFQYARQLEKAKDVIVIGASDCAQMGENIFTGKDVFSHWAPGSGLYFQIAIVNEYEKRDMLPNHVVLALRPYHISRETPRPLGLIASPYHEMLGKLNLKEPHLGFTAADVFNNHLLELFSVKYLVYNLKNEEHNIGIINTSKERHIMYPDGTVVNSFKRQQNIAEKTVQETINTYMDAIRTAKPELIHLHHTFIKHLKKEGVKVSFFILPFHPKMMRDKSFIKANKKWETYTREIANEYNVELLGGTNPTDFALTEDDFLDISHIKRASMSKLFPNKSKENPLQSAL